MGSITMTGYNNIDWTTVLNAVMSQEQQPLANMKSQYTTMQSKSSNYATLATKLSTLESAVDDLKTLTGMTGRTASTTDSSTLTVAAGSTAPVGAYDVIVNSLARAQVTTSATTTTSADTEVATGGSLTINGKTVTLTGSTSLQGLADAINGTEDIGVTATVVSARGAYRLVLTSDDTGAGHAFTVSNDLTGSTFVMNGTPTQSASDADITVNGVEATSSTNVFQDVVPDTTFTVLRENANPTTASVLEDSSALKTKLDTFITAYNDLVSFYGTQAQSAKDGATDSLAHDSLARSLRGEINSTLLESIGASSVFANLSDIGLEFQRDGTLKLNTTTFSDAVKTHQADVQALFAGSGTTKGVFDDVKSAIQNYTQAGALLSDARTRLQDQMASLSDRMSAEQDRLALRKLTLQKEYAAADSAIATLNAMKDSLSSLS